MSTHSTPEIHVEELAVARDRGVVVDVREPQEFVAGHVPGALPIPMSQLGNRVDELDRAVPVYVICASGNRSKAMTDLLRHHGFEAWSVAGGTQGWAQSGRPIENGVS